MAHRLAANGRVSECVGRLIENGDKKICFYAGGGFTFQERLHALLLWWFLFHLLLVEQRDTVVPPAVLLELL